MEVVNLIGEITFWILFSLPAAYLFVSLYCKWMNKYIKNKTNHRYYLGVWVHHLRDHWCDGIAMIPILIFTFQFTLTGVHFAKTGSLCGLVSIAAAFGQTFGMLSIVILCCLTLLATIPMVGSLYLNKVLK